MGWFEVGLILFAVLFVIGVGSLMMAIFDFIGNAVYLVNKSATELRRRERDGD